MGNSLFICHPGEKSKGRHSYKTAPVVLIMVQCLTKGHLRGRVHFADTEGSIKMVCVFHWSASVSQELCKCISFHFNQTPTNIHIFNKAATKFVQKENL